MSENLRSRRFCLKAGVILLAAGWVAVLYRLRERWSFQRRTSVSRESSEISRLSAGTGAPARAVLSSSEHVLLEHLVGMVLPSDGNGPGALDAGVAERIEAALGENDALQWLYRDGLQAIAEAAQWKYRGEFLSLSHPQQKQLLLYFDQVDGRLARDAHTLIERGRRKLYHWYYVRGRDMTPVLEFWNRLRDDVFVHFYSSRIAWAWLGYEGPPFPNGYAMKSESLYDGWK